MLRKFYAVTITSVYEVTSAGTIPRAMKIALRGESRMQVGGLLVSGNRLAITTQLQMYEARSPESRIENVNMHYWGNNSSPIVALFTRKEKAMSCFKTEDRVALDPRWLEDTKRVLDLIGDNHPAFEVCHWGSSALIPTVTAAQ